MTNLPFSCLVRGLHGTGCALAAVLAFTLAATDARAQGGACTLQPAPGGARQILHCQDGLAVEIERGAEYTLTDSNRDGTPDAVQLRNRALLIDVDPSSRSSRFRVLTPQAIAAVRGTQWAVDVAGDKTSVFVLSGRVAVRRVSDRAGVELGPGEGVDVEPGTAPLTVRRWPLPRANALLARFGRQIR